MHIKGDHNKSLRTQYRCLIEQCHKFLNAIFFSFKKEIYVNWIMCLTCVHARDQKAQGRYGSLRVLHGQSVMKGIM